MIWRVDSVLYVRPSTTLIEVSRVSGLAPHPQCDISADTLSRPQSCSGCPYTLRTWRFHSSLRRSCSSNAGASQNTVLSLVLLYRPLQADRASTRRDVYISCNIRIVSSVHYFITLCCTVTFKHIRVCRYSAKWDDHLPVPLKKRTSTMSPLPSSASKAGTTFLLTRCITATDRRTQLEIHLNPK